MSDGIGGTNGFKGKSMIVKKQCLWVSYTVNADNGMQMIADGFYDGSVPVTMPMLSMVRGEIARQTQKAFDLMRPVDQNGKLIIGTPSPKVKQVVLGCIVAAELDEEVTSH